MMVLRAGSDAMVTLPIVSITVLVFVVVFGETTFELDAWEGLAMLTTLGIGLLQVIEYLVAISLAVVVSMGWSWELYLCLAFAIIAVPYAVWREIRNIERNFIECR